MGIVMWTGALVSLQKKKLQCANNYIFWHDIEWFIGTLTARNPVTSFVINVSANTAILTRKHKL